MNSDFDMFLIIKDKHGKLIHVAELSVRQAYTLLETYNIPEDTRNLILKTVQLNGRKTYRLKTPNFERVITFIKNEYKDK